MRRFAALTRLAATPVPRRLISALASRTREQSNGNSIEGNREFIAFTPSKSIEKESNFYPIHIQHACQLSLRQKPSAIGRRLELSEPVAIGQVGRRRSHVADHTTHKL